MELIYCNEFYPVMKNFVLKSFFFCDTIWFNTTETIEIILRRDTEADLGLGWPKISRENKRTLLAFFAFLKRYLAKRNLTAKGSKLTKSRKSSSVLLHTKSIQNQTNLQYKYPNYKQNKIHQ